MYPSTTLKKKIEEAPLAPGCYIYRDQEKNVIYVGKALVLRERVKQYFAAARELGPRIERMVNKIKDVEFVITDSELEALVLETNLIKRYKPKYNVLRKDDKNYMYLRLDHKQSFPKFEYLREKPQDKAKYWGPYMNGGPIKKTLKLLREIFPYRTCNRKIVEKNGKITSSDPKPCLYYFLGLCQAPCAGFITSSEYKASIKNIEKYLDNRLSLIIKQLEVKMKHAAGEKDFELAAEIRDKIQDLKYISQKVDVDPRTDEHIFRKIKSTQNYLALSQLLDLIDKTIESKSGFKIECYDISNIQGTNAVGSMVVFIDGMPQKRLYRKFRIKTKSTPDDFGMLQEVLKRRFKKDNSESKDESFNRKPDLIVIDGGKGQLSAVDSVMKELGIELPLVGLAKRNEDIFKIEAGEFIKIELPKGSEARFLMQRIRDETHRFGIDYHRKLREKAQKFSLINEIPGVGKVLGIKLLKAFGSLEGLRKASKQEIYAVVHNKRTVDNIIKLLSA
ncbi:MAG TPA: excinuclease ABC subunit UvrC [Candidatus Dojkabacteria bacterium]|nr:excinuclease ABC subunit UvrC [Candidatus Dojkabacteria bacterium]